MFYCTLDGQYIQEGQQFTIRGVEYPSNWLNLSTPEEKAALGLEEVIATNQPYDPVYYWTGEILDKATLTYTGTPKALTDVKSNAINQVNNSAYSILFPTDWMSIKAIETSVPMPANWRSWRESIRTTAASTVSLIEAAADVNAVAVIMGNIAWPKNPDQVALEAAQLAEEPLSEEPAIKPTGSK